MNEFISYPVGQGFFYSGTINKFQLVYDCGVESKGKSKIEINSLKRLVDYYELEVNDTKVIDMLVISHFDYDHVSGLLYLLSKYNVRKMYIPYYNNPKILYLINLLIYISGSFIEDIILIPPLSNDNEPQEPGDERLEPFESDDIPKDSGFRVFVGGNSFIDCDIEWEFYFFNMPIKNGAELDGWINPLKDKIDELMTVYGVDTISELVSVLKNIHSFTIKEIKELIYKEELENNSDLTKGDWSNNSSLCLYHRPRLKGKTLFSYSKLCCDFDEWYHDYCCSYHRVHRTGTLLTGDINLANKRIKEFRKWLNQNSLEESTGVIYLPHHGAIKNWHEYLKNVAVKNNSISISSAGKNNSYGHPSSKIMMDYKRSGLIHIKCDEDNHFEYYID
ncbi:hypothetical protein P7H60_11355 [Vagococcus carniphilus]|uniref:MBL fold metallo-hydrolase n=1 Tax=Vagococcus carniphilus TaxID=218144 RepID=UPI00288DB1A3|nr:MBL fold metallo-hydrolase [Vagococcus carniphilus]MDT2849738.1 hypothetical protein [Vagococcus carniphilus]